MMDNDNGDMLLLYDPSSTSGRPAKRGFGVTVSKHFFQGQKGNMNKMKRSVTLHNPSYSTIEPVIVSNVKLRSSRVSDLRDQAKQEDHRPAGLVPLPLPLLQD